MPDEIVLTVNGKRRIVRAAPETPLLYVLRNDLGLSGPHYGCGEETCGACMVLIGAHAKQSQTAYSYREEADGMIHETYVW